MAKISKMLPCVLVAISTFQAMIRAQAFSRAVGTEGQSPPPLPLFWQISFSNQGVHITTTRLLLASPQDFQTFRRPCSVVDKAQESSTQQSEQKLEAGVNRAHI